MSDEESPSTERSPEAAPALGEEESMRALVRGAMREREETEVDVLKGVQRKLFERSRGKFYPDGWSTTRHPPVTTFLVTSLLMLAVLGVAYAVLRPLSGDPRPVHNQPAPVQVVAPPPK